MRYHVLYKEMAAEKYTPQSIAENLTLSSTGSGPEVMIIQPLPAFAETIFSGNPSYRESVEALCASCPKNVSNIPVSERSQQVICFALAPDRLRAYVTFPSRGDIPQQTVLLRKNANCHPK